jgi:hypothetical protein
VVCAVAACQAGCKLPNGFNSILHLCLAASDEERPYPGSGILLVETGQGLTAELSPVSYTERHRVIVK